MRRKNKDNIMISFVAYIGSQINLQKHFLEMHIFH